MDFHEAYTVRMFYSGQTQFQEDEFFAASETVAYNYAADVAKAAGASHFNVSKGKDRPRGSACHFQKEIK